jgi:hypothetical protein
MQKSVGPFSFYHTYGTVIARWKSQRYRWGWAKGWTIGVLGFDSLRVLGIFLFTTVSRTALDILRVAIVFLSLSIRIPE